MNFLFYTNIILFIFVSLMLILLILIQKGRGGGLSGAFGGAGGNTAFGAKTGDVLTWATSIIFAVFVLLAITLNLLANYKHANTSNGLIAPVAAETATDTPTTAPSAAGAPDMPNTPAVPVEPTTKP